MSGKTATVVGATGLIGGELIQQLFDDPYFNKVRAIVRRPLAVDNQKLEKKLVDFNDADSLLMALDGSDVVFVAVGTTQQKVKGDKQAYRKVDYDIPVNLARYCKIVGCEKYVLVSSVGANAKSNNFYLKLKGEVEDSIKQTGIGAVHIMRPSLLLGSRNESRPLEKFVQSLMAALSFLLPSKYKPIAARDIARAMARISKTVDRGFFVYEYNDIKQLAQDTL